MGFCLLSASLVCCGDDTGDDGGDAVSYLVFETQLDGRCQILSAGGKLLLLRNQHPEYPIRYRLIRRFAGLPQNRVIGVIQPRNSLEKLGCNRVDGRPQHWQIERAQFVEE